MQRTTAETLPARGNAGRVARLLLLLLLLNVAVDLLLRTAGLVLSPDSALPLSDPFADFFGFAVSFPGGERVDTAFAGLSALLDGWRASAPDDAAAALAAGQITHFNAPPVVALIGLLDVRLMQAVEPALLYAAMLLGLVAYWSRIVPGERWAWVSVMLVSYPFLTVAVRGNIYAGLCALLIAHATMLTIRGGSPRLVALLVALAVGIRPNAIIFCVPLLMLCGQPRQLFASLAVAGPAVSGLALFAAHALYPNYTLAAFRAGVAIYHQTYVIEHWGIPFGSSTFGALVLLIGDRPGLEVAAAMPAAVIALAAIWLHWRGRVSPSAFLFLIAAAYALGSTIFADYHLLIFLLPLLLATTSEVRTATDRVVTIASVLVLAPKNYLYEAGVSIQPVLNPLILLAASAAIIALSWRSSRAMQAEPATA